MKPFLMYLFFLTYISGFSQTLLSTSDNGFELYRNPFNGSIVSPTNSTFTNFLYKWSLRGYANDANVFNSSVLLATIPSSLENLPCINSNSRFIGAKDTKGSSLLNYSATIFHPIVYKISFDFLPDDFDSDAAIATTTWPTFQSQPKNYDEFSISPNKYLTKSTCEWYNYKSKYLLLPFKPMYFWFKIGENYLYLDNFLFEDTLNFCDHPCGPLSLPYSDCEIAHNYGTNLTSSANLIPFCPGQNNDPSNKIIFTLKGGVYARLRIFQDIYSIGSSLVVYREYSVPNGFNNFVVEYNGRSDDGIYNAKEGEYLTIYLDVYDCKGVKCASLIGGSLPSCDDNNYGPIVYNYSPTNTNYFRKNCACTNSNIDHPTSLTLTSIDKIYNAPIIESAATIQNSNIVYRAKTRITLKPGFKVSGNGRFVAQIDSDCSSDEDNVTVVSKNEGEGTYADASTSDYSDVDANNEKNQISLHPNPSKQVSVLTLRLAKDATTDVQIYNLKGEFVKAYSAVMFPAGLNQFSLDVSSFSAGVYIVRLPQLGEGYTQKLVVAE